MKTGTHKTLPYNEIPGLIALATNLNITFWVIKMIWLKSTTVAMRSAHVGEIWHVCTRRIYTINSTATVMSAKNDYKHN